MFANHPIRWRRRAMWAAVLSAASLAATGAAGLAASGSVAGPAAAVLSAGQAGSRSQVPWAKVGPGWELVQYSPGTYARHAPTTLYLVDPHGGRYALYTWPARGWPPGLIAWSGDKTRVLLLAGANGKTEQLTLATGRITSFSLAGQAMAIGYTRPGGLNILGRYPAGSNTTLARFSLTGQLVKVLATGPGYDAAIYSSDGATLAVSGRKGLELVSNRGGVIRQLPVPGAGGCSPVRWWDSRTILASCAAGAASSRLWLVPVDGARPTALTPQRNASSQDLGDLGAWQMPSGLYLQAAGPCGSVQIFRQAANGSITPVRVPHTTGNDNWIVTVAGTRMLLKAETGCPGSNSLVWYNPRTKAEQWLMKTPDDQFGVLGVAAYYSRENAS